MARDPWVAMYKDALDATGLPWTVENGSKHKKVYLAGRLVAVLPNSRVNTTGTTRANSRTLRDIEKLANEIKTRRADTNQPTHTR